MIDLQRIKKITKWLIYIGYAESDTDLAKKLGYTKSSLSQILNGKVPVSEKFVEKLCNTDSDINKVWITDDGEYMLKSEIKKLEKNRFLVSDFKQKGYSPYYSDLLVSAGQYDLAILEKEEIPESWIKFPGISVDAWFPIIGCSMEPKVYTGDIIGVINMNRWDKLDPDKIYLIITRDDRMIKHLEIDENDSDIIWAVSENYKRFKILVNDILKIFHVVFTGRAI